MKMTKCVQLMILVCLLPILVYSAESDYRPEWRYKCIRGGCRRVEIDTKKPASEYYRSLSVCRNVCGRFGGLWPMPTAANISKKTIKINPNKIKFNLKYVPVAIHQLLLSMTQVAKKNLLAECRGNVIEDVDTQVHVFINVKTDSDQLTWETKEQYLLTVDTNRGWVAVKINAISVYGARHAMETFVQLVAPDIAMTSSSNTTNNTCSLNIVTSASITDKPVFPHRGVLLDTSRHFFPIESIKKMIDAMASTKMNVFHWHLSDSASFPLKSGRVPQLARYGAYSENETYSLKEVRDLVKYAQINGIRIVIEIDTPGHTANGWQWGQRHGLGDLAVCINYQPWLSYCRAPPCGQLNPANNNVYVVLEQIYREISEVLLQPPLLHLGGDEVVFHCWNTSAQINKYMKQKGYSNLYNKEGFMQLWSEFNSKAVKAWDKGLKIIGVKPQPVMVWASQLTEAHRIRKYLNPLRYVIEVWGEPTAKEHEVIRKLIRLKYRVVVAPGDWYLDHGFWEGTSYSNWITMYSRILYKSSAVLGGEVAMWSELVDSLNLDGKMWPRAAAAAERLWSNPSTGAKDAQPRLQRMRERLVSRGVRADVISPAWCTQNDFQC